MIKNIEIPFEIGDTVWAVTRDIPSEDYSYRFGKLAIYKTKIQSIKAIFYKDKSGNSEEPS